MMDVCVWHYQFRLVVLGDSTVGKTSLLRRYTEDLFLDTANHTVGVDFFVHFLEVEPGVHVKLQFWDTAGQERFRSVTRSYYRNSVGGLLVFDLGNRETFQHVRAWQQEVCERVAPHSLLLVLVGHKSDLEGRQVSREEAESLAIQLGAPYVEASARSGEGVAQAVQLLAQQVYQGLQGGKVQLREGWDGVKCYPLQVTTLHVPSSSPATPSSRKCCD